MFVYVSHPAVGSGVAVGVGSTVGTGVGKASPCPLIKK